LANVAAFSLATCLRAANVTGLQWSQVDLARRLAWIHSAKAASARPCWPASTVGIKEVDEGDLPGFFGPIVT